MAESTSESIKTVFDFDDTRNSIISEMVWQPLALLSLASPDFKTKIPKGTKLYLNAIQREFPFVRFVAKKNKTLSLAELKDLYFALRKHHRKSPLANYTSFDKNSIPAADFEKHVQQIQGAKLPPVIQAFHVRGIAYMPEVDFFMLVAHSPGVFLDNLISENPKEKSLAELTEARVRLLSAFVPKSSRPDTDEIYREIYARIVLMESNGHEPIFAKLSQLHFPPLRDIQNLLDLACRLGHVEIVDTLYEKLIYKDEPRFLRIACDYEHKAVANCLMKRIPQESRAKVPDYIKGVAALSWNVVEVIDPTLSKDFLAALLPSAANRGNVALVESILLHAKKSFEHSAMEMMQEQLLKSFKTNCCKNQNDITALRDFWSNFQSFLIPSSQRLLDAMFAVIPLAVYYLDAQDLMVLFCEIASKIVLGQENQGWFNESFFDALMTSNLIKLAILLEIYQVSKALQLEIDRDKTLNLLSVNGVFGQDFKQFDAQTRNDVLYKLLRVLLRTRVNLDICTNPCGIGLSGKPITFIIRLLLGVGKSPYVEHLGATLSSERMAAVILRESSRERNFDNTKQVRNEHQNIGQLISIYLDAYESMLRTEQDCAKYIFKKLKHYSGYGMAVPARLGRFISGRVNTTFGKDVAELFESMDKTPLDRRRFALPFQSAADVKEFFTAMQNKLAAKPNNSEGEYHAIEMLANIFFCENSPFLEVEKVSPSIASSSSNPEEPEPDDNKKSFR